VCTSELAPFVATTRRRRRRRRRRRYCNSPESLLASTVNHVPARNAQRKTQQYPRRKKEEREGQTERCVSASIFVGTGRSNWVKPQ
jgi:hypothetical protein